ncbi:MAG TPA: hypothetical protein VMR70_07170 [Flavisolibacter sp.]|nr:hypothetical protein [Flavisolibacter sp.]
MSLSTRSRFAVLLFAVAFLLTSCLTSKKLDKYVASQYNNELPKPKKTKSDIVVIPAMATDNNAISNSAHQTNNFLPLLLYWQYKHRQNCNLNPAIAITQFSNAINTQATKGLNQKLNGQKLELTVEQAPSAFAIVSNEHTIWLVYTFSWAKVFIEPDFKDLVVSYRVLQGEQPVKTGKITVKNTDKNRGIRFFQSWKSATSEYLNEYNTNLASMSKSFVTQLTEQL